MQANILPSVELFITSLDQNCRRSVQNQTISTRHGSHSEVSDRGAIEGDHATISVTSLHSVALQRARVALCILPLLSVTLADYFASMSDVDVTAIFTCWLACHLHVTGMSFNNNWLHVMRLGFCLQQTPVNGACAHVMIHMKYALSGQTIFK